MITLSNTFVKKIKDLICSLRGFEESGFLQIDSVAFETRGLLKEAGLL